GLPGPAREGDAIEPVLLFGDPRPDRAWSRRGVLRPVSVRPASRLRRCDRHRTFERSRAGLLGIAFAEWAGGATAGLANSARRGPAVQRAPRLFGVREVRSLPATARSVVSLP